MSVVSLALLLGLATAALGGCGIRPPPSRAKRAATKRNVVELKVHPAYIPDAPHPNDIALLKLDIIPYVYNEAVAHICLPSASQPIPDNANAVATGFGANNVTNHDVLKPIVDGLLRETVVPIVSQANCSWSWDGAIPRNTVCASSKDRGFHKGDSGGPLAMMSSAGAWYQIGVASYLGSFDGGMDGETYPKVWTDVRKFCPWIKEATNGEAHCQDEEVLLENVKESEIGIGIETTKAPPTTVEPAITEEPVTTEATKITESTAETSETSDEPEISVVTTEEASDEPGISEGSIATDEPEASHVTAEESETSDEPESTELTTTSDDSDESDEVETIDDAIFAKFTTKGTEASDET